VFQIRWKPARETTNPPDAMEWWARSLGSRDPLEQIMQLSHQLRSAIARADHSERPVFLRALGRDLESELQELADRIAFGTGVSGFELTQRRELLEEMVDYYCNAVMPWTKATHAIELSDCAREAVAGLSADMQLVLRVQGEPLVTAVRRRLIALCEVAIRAAASHVDDEVGVVLPPCTGEHAELRVTWAGSRLAATASRDKARFLGLAMVYVAKLGGTLRQSSGVEEALVLRIPVSRYSEDELPATSVFDSGAVSPASSIGLEG
jgi:hypothetical protein